MIVYHGSNSRFETLRIRKDLVKSEATLLNEGLGIYFSLHKDVARSYGKYLYTLNIDDNAILDFRKKSVCKKYIQGIIKSIYKQVGINISNYFNIDTVVESVYLGKVGVSGICREIYFLLDSYENWYQVNENVISNVYSILDTYDKKTLVAYLFNYNIKGIGILKNVDSSIVTILSRE